MRTAIRFALVVILLAVACGGCEDQPARRLYEKAGGFSYDPPPEWKIGQMPGLKYQVCHGPRTEGFAPNINVVDEEFPGSLAQYVDANLKNMAKVFENLKVLRREDFRTEDGTPCIRVVAENEQKGHGLRQSFYFFGNTNRKYVATCTTPAEGGESLDDVFAKSMKTFRIH